MTLDAMGCQEKIVEKIVQREADYVIAVKNNQPKLCVAIADQFEEYLENDLQDKKVRSSKQESRPWPAGSANRDRCSSSKGNQSVRQMEKH